MGDRLTIAVVGAGDVTTRYARSADIGWRFDIVDRRDTIRVPADIPTAARKIAATVPPDVPIVVATPPAAHLAYLRALADTHYVLVEKPLVVGPPPDDLPPRWFALGYYALEKGLPALALLQPAFRTATTLACLDGDVDAIDDIARTLGPVRRLIGVIVEGPDHRPWIRDPIAGGVTWDLLYHLASFVAALAPGARAHSTGRRDDARWLHVRGSLDASLLAMKGGEKRNHQRWLFLECRGGRVRLDFGTCRLVAETATARFELGLKDPTPYATQFTLAMVRQDPLAAPPVPANALALDTLRFLSQSFPSA